MRFYWANPFRNITKIIFVLIGAGLATFLIAQGFEWRSHWDQIENRQSLKVAVRESEGVFWANGQEFAGFEHDLITELEKQLDIPIKIFAVRDLDDLYRSLEVGAVDMALPGSSLSDTIPFPKSLSYSATRIGLVLRKKTDDSEASSQQLRTGILDKLAHEDAMNYILGAQTYSAGVYEHGRLSAELFTLVEMKELEQALVDERDFQLQQNVFPTLEFSPLNLPARPISILFHPKEDGSLSEKVNSAILDLEFSGLLTQITDRYFGHALEFDYVDNLTFERHMEGRLPNFEALFRLYGENHTIDWRLLAAVAYQESHWRADAKSPTGVRGLMMITLNTAKELGIDNRLDPEQSTKAGSQYIANLKERVPERITDPDRTWFALASYNVGSAHLEDARRITELLGDNPDRWIDVRKHLPKLALKDYYPWTRYGYARGNEPVVYVANIRRFYDRLKKAFPETSELAEPERLDQLPEAIVPAFPGL